MSRVESCASAMAVAKISAWAALARATGTRHFIALWAGIFPATTSRWTAGDSTRIRSNRRVTQLLLLPSRSATTARSIPA